MADLLIILVLITATLMVAMVLDELNSGIGRKPLAIDLNALGALDWITMDTIEIVRAFGIKEGFHLVIDLITFSSPAGDAGNIITFVADFIRDTTEDPPDSVGLVADIVSRSAIGVWFHIINAANTGVAMTPVDVYNTFAFQDVSGSTDSVMMVWFHQEEGPMDFSQENRAAQIDVRQLTDVQGDAGDQYRQLDDHVNQLFAGSSE